MKIIGHRGAAGLALENTLESFTLAEKLGVDAIELDVRLSKDKKLVVFHDKRTWRLSKQNLRIRDTNYADLRRLTLRDGHSHIPLLEEVLMDTKSIPLYIELKVRGSIKLLIELLAKHSEREVTILTSRVEDLREAHQKLKRPTIFLSGLLRPFKALRLSGQSQFNGVGLGLWQINPLSYWVVRWSGFQPYIWTIDRTWLLWLAARVFPNAYIATNRPDRLIKIRDKLYMR